MIKSSIKALFHRMGLDVMRYHTNRNPQYTLLGLRSRPIRTVLDIGANVGQSARFYRRLFRDATIYCFEPLPQAYQILEDWAQTQQGKIKTFNMALGDEAGEVEMNVHLDHSASSSLLNTTATSTRLYPQTQKQREATVTLERLDSLTPSLEIREEMLVKMDVQGYEAKVIQGGQEVLTQAVACIIEVNLQPLFGEQPSFDEIVGIMGELRFAYGGNLSQEFDAYGYVTFVDAIFLKGSLSEWLHE